MELRRVSLPGNRSLVVRPLLPSDFEGLEALYRRMSEDDLYKRFFTAQPPPESFLSRMLTVGDRGGVGLAVTLEGPASLPRLVAEACCLPLRDGDAEVGMTVEGSLRGWLGPYLLDIVVEEARARGFANLRAEVLASNRQMLAVFSARGYAVLGYDNQPEMVTLCIGTAGRTPVWSRWHERQRVLAEVSGGRWRMIEATRRAGFEVLACPGVNRRLPACPVLGGRPCPLAAGADVIVEAVPGDAGQALLRGHRRLHPAVPLCVDSGGDDDGLALPRIQVGMDSESAVSLLKAVALPLPNGEPGDPALAPPAR
jgi:hypothetical protein